MAKETFERTKPHVNIGTATQVFQDTSGELMVEGRWSEEVGNPDSSTILTLTAPPQSTAQTFVVGYPFDEDFSYDPAVFGPALSFDFSVDVLPIVIEGATRLDVVPAILQEHVYVAPSAVDLTSDIGDWHMFREGGTRLFDIYGVVDHAPSLNLSRPFEFGFAFIGEYSSEGLRAEVAVDNIVVEITPVPESTSIALVAAMGVALVWNRLRRGSEDEKM